MQDQAKKVDFSSGMSPMYIAVRCMQMEGTFPGKGIEGVGMMTVHRMQRLYGNVSEDMFPYDVSSWPPQPRPELDELAKEYRIYFCALLRSEEEVKAALRLQVPVCVDLRITSQWYSTENGVIEMPDHNFCDVHAITVTGYDDANQYFQFMNSWGSEWGNSGFGWLPYGYIDTQMTGLSIVLLDPKFRGTESRCLMFSGHHLRVASCTVDVPVRGELSCTSIIDPRGVDVAWAYAYVTDEYFEIEEFFVTKEYRRQGVGRLLMNELNKKFNEELRPARVWFSHTDQVLLGSAIHDIAYSFRLNVHKSPSLWASKILTTKA